MLEDTWRADFPRHLWREEREPNKSLGTLLPCTKKSYYLRYPLWRDKAGGLDHRQAGPWEHVYQLDFHPCRNNFLGNNENWNSSFLDLIPHKTRGWGVRHADIWQVVPSAQPVSHGNIYIHILYRALARSLQNTLVIHSISHNNRLRWIKSLLHPVQSVKLQARNRELIKQLTG